MADGGWGRPGGGGLDPPTVERSVPEAFRDAAARHGERAAVVDDAEVITYDELDGRTNAVASAVRVLAPSDGAPTLVFAAHGPSAVVAMLGIVKAGVPYGVLDPRAPHAYRAALVEHLRATVIVGDRANRSAARELVPAQNVIDLEAVIEAGADDPGVTPDPHAPVYISFTSGTSGTPKAVTHSHRNVVNNARRFGAAIDVTPDDRFLVASPFQYVGSATAVYAALLSGAAVCPYSFATRGASSFPTFARNVGLTVAQFAPAHVAAVAESARRDGTMPDVRLVNLGGDRLEWHHVGAVRACFGPRTAVLHRYNTSETNWVSGVFIGRDATVDDGPLPIGWPVPWVETEIRDEDGRVVDGGEPGELVVRGDHLALGYWGDPERTAERFVDTPAGREYHTGDRVRRRADGMLEFLGRREASTKVRGVLVDPVGVERAIESMPRVQQAAVVPWTHASGERRLAAFVVGGGLNARDVRQHLAARLPQAMVPAAVTFVDALPLTARDKIDTEVLRTRATSAAGQPTEPPRDGTERSIAGHFGDVLHIDDVGRDDDFFDLGGDSLDMVELSDALTQELGVGVAPSLLLERPTPALLAVWAREGDHTTPDIVRLSRGSDDRLPVFMFGGAGGDPTSMLLLARALSDRTIHAVVPRAYEDRGRPDRTIVAEAASAAEAIRGAQPSGPYVVVGHSSGGIVAFETARSLTAAGETVALLVLLDSGGPDRSRFHRMEVRLKRTRRRIAEEDAGVAKRLRRYGHLVRRASIDSFRSMTAGIVARNGARQRHAFRSLRNRKLSRYRASGQHPGPTLLVRATRGRGVFDARSEHPDLGWSPYLTGDFSIVEVPGSHAHMVEEPYVGATAAAIADAFAAVDNGHGTMDT